MSTLKTHNLQSPDAGSVNIVMAPNAGMVVAGLSTYSNQINVGNNIKLGNAGVITATSFSGSGANLTGNIYADNYFGNGGITLNNNGNPSVNLTSTSTTGSSRINFGDPDSSSFGKIYYIHDGDYFKFDTAGSEKLRITSSGDVGIGYDSPTVKLHVREGASGASSYDNRYHMICENNGEAYLGFYVPDNQYAGIRFVDTTGLEGSIDYYFSNDEMHFHSSAKHIFKTGGTERLRINSSGNLGLGESSSIDARLHVNSGTDNATLFLESTDGDVNLCMADNAGSCRLLQAGGNLRFRTGGNANVFGTGDTERMVLDGDGRLLIGTTTEGLATYGENLTIGSVGNGGMTIRTGTGNKGTVYFSDGTSGNAEFKGSIQYDHSDDTLRLAAGATERLRIASDGEVIVRSAANTKGLSIYTGSNRKIAELIDQNADGQLRLYTGESTPVLRTLINSYGSSYINSNGTNYFGIGTASPAYALDVASSEDAYGIRTTCGIRLDSNTSSNKTISTAAGIFYVTGSLTTSDNTWYTVAKIQYATGSFTCVVGDASSRNVMTGHFMATIPAYGVSFLSKKESSGAWNTGSSDIQFVNDGSHMAIQVKHDSYYNDSNSAGCYLILNQCY